MGVEVSTPTCSPTWTNKYPSIRNTLQEYDICTYQEIYEKITSRHLSAGNFIDKSSLLSVLPFPATISSQLAAIFDYDEDDIVNWKSCLGGVLFCVQGQIPEKLHLFFHLHAKLNQCVSQKQLLSMLLNLLLAVDRICSAGTGKKGAESATFYNSGKRMLGDAVSTLYKESKDGQFTTRDIESWVKQHPEVIDKLMELRANPATSKGEDSQHSGGPRSPASIRRHGLSYIWQTLEPGSAGSVPATRTRHAMCLYDGAIYMYGGKDGSIAHKDLWRYNIVGNRWERLQFTGDRPYCLEEHTMLAYRGKLYIFGGQFGENGNAPLWIYNIDKSEWTRHKVDSEVTTPGGRRSHSAVIAGSGMHIYGGYVDLKGSTSELWTFDLEHNMWHLAYSSSMCEDGAGPRHGHTAVVHDNHMWVYGGMTDLQPRDDFWKWSFSKLKWSRVKGRSQVPPLYGHTASKVANTMLLFGGQSAGELQQDVWCFDFTTQSWHKVQLMGSPPPARIRHCAVVVTPITLNSGSAASPRSQSIPLLRETLPLPENITQRPSSSPAAPEDAARLNRSFRNKVTPTFSLHCPQASGAGRQSESKSIVPTVKQRPIDNISQVFDQKKMGNSASKQQYQYSKATDTQEGSILGATSHNRLSIEDTTSQPHFTSSTSSPELRSSRGGASNTLSSQTSLCHSMELNTSQTGHSLVSVWDSTTPLLPLNDLEKGLQNPSLETSAHQDLDRDPVVPVKRNRTATQFSDDFVIDGSIKYASLDSILSASTPQGQDRSSFFDQNRPASLDSLLSSFGAVGMSYSHRSVSREDLPTRCRRASVHSNDLFLEDLESELQPLLQTAANREHQSELSLHDCDNHSTNETSGLLTHINRQSVHARNAFVNQSFETGNSTNLAPNSRSIASASRVSFQMTSPAAGAAAVNTNANAAVANSPPRTLPEHQPFECWAPPSYQTCVERDSQPPPYFAFDDTEALQAWQEERPRNSKGVVVALPVETSVKRREGAEDSDPEEDNQEQEPLLQQQQQQQQRVRPEVWSVTSDLKSMHYPYHVYVFGGRESKSQNLGLQILPITGWKLVIE